MKDKTRVNVIVTYTEGYQTRYTEAFLKAYHKEKMQFLEETEMVKKLDFKENRNHTERSVFIKD